jgi:hypothetical protein
MGQWFVNISGFDGDKIEGPVSSQRIKELIDEKQVTAKTQVIHPVGTDNKWVVLRQTELMQHIENRERKVTAQAERQQVRQIVQGNVEEAQENGLPELKVEFENTSRDTGKWVTRVEIDPISDEKCLFLNLFADDGTDIAGNQIRLCITLTPPLKSGLKGSVNPDPVIVEIFLDWGVGSVFILDNEKKLGVLIPTLKEVVSRVGSHPPGSMRWNVSNDLHGTILPSLSGGYEAVPKLGETGADRTRRLDLNRVLRYHCVRSLIDEESAVFNVTPDVQNSITARFDLRGLRHALATDELGLKCLAALPEVADHSWVNGAPSDRALSAHSRHNYSVSCLFIMVPCVMLALIAGLLLLDVIPIATDEEKTRHALLLGTFLTLISSLIYLRLRRGSKPPNG